MIRSGPAWCLLPPCQWLYPEQIVYLAYYCRIQGQKTSRFLSMRLLQRRALYSLQAKTHDPESYYWDLQNMCSSTHTGLLPWEDRRLLGFFCISDMKQPAKCPPVQIGMPEETGKGPAGVYRVYQICPSVRYTQLIKVCRIDAPALRQFGYKTVALRHERYCPALPVCRKHRAVLVVCSGVLKRFLYYRSSSVSVLTGNLPIATS